MLWKPLGLSLVIVAGFWRAPIQAGDSRIPPSVEWIDKTRAQLKELMERKVRAYNVLVVPAIWYGNGGEEDRWAIRFEVRFYDPLSPDEFPVGYYEIHPKTINWNEAFDQIEPAINSYAPQFPGKRARRNFRQGIKYHRSGKYKKAMGSFTDALEFAPHFTGARHARYSSLLKQNRIAPLDPDQTQMMLTDMKFMRDAAQKRARLTGSLSFR